MANVEKTLMNRTLTLVINDGVTDSGIAKVKNRSFSYINTAANDVALYNTAKALGDLMSKTVTKVTFSDKSSLQESEEE